MRLIVLRHGRVWRCIIADKGAIDLELNTLDPAIRGPVSRAFHALMDGWRLGEPGEGKRGINAQWYQRTFTTPANANTEFTIAHGLAAIPVAIYPVLFLDQVNSQMVPLTVSRAADVNRIYLKSSSTGATGMVWVEA